jgi:uncharacterized protein (TIGR02145 family)
MKMKNKEMTMPRYILYVSAGIVLLCGLTFLLSSCDKEAVGSGQRVAVEISINAGQEALRSLGERKIAPEMQAISLGNNLYLCLTLSEDSTVSDALRAGAPGALDNGQKIRVAAYRADDGTLESVVNYWNDNGTLTPDAVNAYTSLEVEEGVPYKFVAYSYRSTTDYPPAGDVLTNVDSNYDLLWGTTTAATQTITASDPDSKKVNILMTHKFAQVSLNLSTTTSLLPSTKITGLTSATIASGDLRTLDVKTGNLSSGTIADQSFDFSGATFPGDVIESAKRRIYPVLSSLNTTTVTINGLTATISGTVVSIPDPSTVIFRKALDAGEHYRLDVAVRYLNCGTEGIALPLTIGGRSYLTHLYGNKCWMVENSMEGTPSATYYYNDNVKVNGYYYTQAQAPGACPSGWHLPTATEYTNSWYDVQIMGGNPMTNTYLRWWFGPQGAANGAFAGERTNESQWEGWDVRARWWTSTINTCIVSSATLSYSTLPGEKTSGWYSVRCIRDY